MISAQPNLRYSNHVARIQAIFSLCIILFSTLNLSCSNDDHLILRPPYLAASGTLIDFGERIIGTQDERTIYLINKGEQVLTLEEPQGDGQNGVFSLILDTNIIETTKDSIIRVIFNPVDQTTYESVFTLKNNSTNEPVYTLTLKGTGIEPGPCYGVNCTQAPSPTCISSTTSRIFEPNGQCIDGVCENPYLDEECQYGCDFETGLCRGSPCAGIVCDSPPSDCYFAIGECVEGACNYTLNNQTTCSDSNGCTQNDACVEGVCLGTPIVCNSPPSPICVNANTARSWNPQGACVPENGSCNYPQNDQYCEFGCINGFCDGDPCEGITCNTPPSPQCYNPDGICINGVCIYSSYSGPCNDSNNCTNGDVCVNAICQGTPVACTTPPSAECASDNTVRMYNTTGACTEAGCEYGSVVSACNDGSVCTANDYCDSGACHPGPLNNCDDSNPCTTNWCDPVLGCQTDLLSGGSCVASSSDCPLGTCVSGTCMPVPDTTCTAEVGIDLCVEVEAPGRCTAAGECVPTEAPPGFTCPGCNGICIQCWIFQYCFEF